MPLAPPGARSAARRVALLALGASLITCRLDKLLRPAIADRLAVSPDSLQESAHAGSSDTLTVTVLVATADGATLPWTATETAAWLSLSQTSGGAPDTLVVTLDPGALSEGLYQDEIVFASAQTSDTVRLPVTFQILPPAPELSVSPTSRVDSAFARSALPDTFTLQIKNRGALPLTWTAVLDTAWVTLFDSGGSVPAQDSAFVLVTLRPESLAAGTHRGTISVTAPGAIGTPATVPITYTIEPCAETGLTPDVVVTDSVTLSDCGAPRKAGSQAKLYAVQATTGDTLSFRLTAAFNAFLVLTNSAGDSLAANDECGVEVGTACIMDFIVPAAGRYVIEATTAGSGETGTFTLSAVKERTPSAPAAAQFRTDNTTAIGVGAVTPESTVVFKATVNDPNPLDSVRLEVEVEGLATGLQTYSSTLALRGTNVALPVSGLNDNEGYHWRARTCDKTGRCSTWFSFGGNVDPAVDFFVNSVPQPPDAPISPNQFNGVGQTAIPPGGGTGGGLGSNQTVTFRALVTDPDPGDLISLEVEVKDVGDGFNEPEARGVAVSSGSTASVSVSRQAPLLVGQNNYHWRVRACDQTNRCGAWVPFGSPSVDEIDFHVP